MVRRSVLHCDSIATHSACHDAVTLVERSLKYPSQSQMSRSGLWQKKNCRQLRRLHVVSSHPRMNMRNWYQAVAVWFRHCLVWHPMTRTKVWHTPPIFLGCLGHGKPMDLVASITSHVGDGPPNSTKDFFRWFHIHS